MARLIVDGKEKVCDYFAVKTIGTVRPGDDFLLRFQIDYGTGEADPGSFLACYDKKMLWRANLYVDERPRDANGNLTGGVSSDWNDLNPWNDPANNDWYVSQANGASVNGGQITIKPWTMLNGAEYFASGGDVFNSVAYTTGGVDSVADFNADLVEQSNNNNGSTLAPKLPDANNPWNNYSSQSYRPNFSYMKMILKQYTRYTAACSSGVDCGGFVMRAASYKCNGNHFYNIAVPDDSKRDIMDPQHPDDTTKYPQNMAYPDWWSTTGRSYVTLSCAIPNNDVNKAIPGDIVLVHKKVMGKNEQGQDVVIEDDSHVAYIQRIVYDINSRNTDKTRVILIEANTYVSARLTPFTGHAVFPDFTFIDILWH